MMNVNEHSIVIIQMSQTISNYKQILNKHQSFLKKFKVFPDKTRKSIWAQLLQLPLNHQHFTQLTKPFPLLPQHTIDKQVSFIVSSFTRLYPDLAVQWLPGIIYPFVMLFKQDAIAAFQISMTFVINWFRPIFEDYPNSSKKIMGFFSKKLKKLQKKVNSLDYPLSSIIQPLLLVSLTDILNKQNTLEIFDYLAAHPYTPQLYLCIIATILSKVQEKLCTLNTVEDIALTLRKEKNLNIQQIVSQAVQLSIQEQAELNVIYTSNIFPLTKSRYPICQFIKQVKPLQNNKLLKTNEQEMNRLKNKFQNLQKLVQNKLKSDTVMNSQQLQKRYADIQGQMRQYLNMLREQHKNKLIILRQMQDNYKQKIAQQNKNHNYQEELQAIQRRGRLEREILLMQKQAKNIREAQQNMLKRIEEVTRIKKEQLEHENTQLKYQQRKIRP